MAIVTQSYKTPSDSSTPIAVVVRPAPRTRNVRGTRDPRRVEFRHLGPFLKNNPGFRIIHVEYDDESRLQMWGWSDRLQREWLLQRGVL